MLDVSEAIEQLIATAELDDIDFAMVIDTARDVGTNLPGANETERVLHFIGLLLDHGFVPVRMPYPSDEPWPEKEQDAILARVRREWANLSPDLTVYHLPWFRGPNPFTARSETPP